MLPGLERIKVLASEIKDKATLKVIEYLLSRNDMDEKYLNEEKSLTQMIKYIKKEARKQATNGMAMVEDNEVYSWAIHYWDETNASLGIDKKIEKTTVEPKTEEDKEEVEEPKKVEKKRKNWVPEGQLSLFDM